MVIQEGFEPPTHGLEGRCSIQLSYWTACYRPYSLTTSVYHIRTASENGQKNGAGEGNRTLVTSLEGWGSTIELHPHMVGAAGFEPATPWSQARCATKLRYAPFCQHCYYSKSVDLRQPLLLRFIQLNS